ncbi:hypothetical protein GF351_03730 [Candidatus Woesearchaeota archaeon]|nr:hypothetical protein [Candidatus Woesearchaeota archaeon]
MTDLIACLSTGKGTWGHVSRLISGQGWSKVFLITNSFGKERFTPAPNVELVVIDPEKPLPELAENVRLALQGKVSGMEIALNLVSGSGKEHMAVLSAVLKLGMGVRLVSLTEKGISEI